mgnify:CR=1 FL=1
MLSIIPDDVTWWTTREELDEIYKIIDQIGNTRFSVKNSDGTFKAENLSRLRLRIDFPDLENQIDTESIVKS